MDDIWDAKRIALQDAVKESILNLFQHTGSDSLYLPIDKNLCVVAGTEHGVRKILVNKS